MHNISVTIPLNADTGVTLRMRVISEDEPNLPGVIMSPCMDLVNGQAEDYGVVIRGATSIANTNNTAAQMKLYPNPASNTLSVSLAVKDQYTISVMSADGRMVMSAETESVNTTLDVSALPTGVYILKAKGTDNVYTQRFSKQ